jgi:hypothetical protein
MSFWFLVFGFLFLSCSLVLPGFDKGYKNKLLYAPCFLLFIHHSPFTMGISDV